MFLSTSHNKIDKKGRVSVPASYRSQIEAEGGPLILFKSLQFKCLEGTSLKRMIQYVDAIDELDAMFKSTITDSKEITEENKMSNEDFQKRLNEAQNSRGYADYVQSSSDFRGQIDKANQMLENSIIK